MTVSIVLVRSLFAELAARGLDVEDWLTECAISRVRMMNPTAMLSYGEARVAVRAAVNASGDLTIGHAAGLRTPAWALPSISPLLLAATTVREAALTFIRYARLVSEGPLYILEEDGYTATWGFTPASELDNAETQVMVDYAIAFTVSVARMLHGAQGAAEQGPSLLAVRFQHREPAYSACYREAYRCPILFNQKLNGLVFARELLDRRLPFAHEGLHEHLRGPLNERLRRASRRESWTARVRFILEHAQSFESIDVSSIATRVQLSERTLRRALKRENTSFGTLLEEARQRVAIEKLKQERLTIAEISDLLGYSDPSSFSRAFRSWVGVTPAEYRSGLARHG